MSPVLKTPVLKTTALAALAALALVLAPVAHAASAQAAGGLTGHGASKPKSTIHCSSGPSCSVLIAKCVERDGHWDPKGYGPQGEPVRGSCTM